MSPALFKSSLAYIVLCFGIYVLLKFSFFFVLKYPARRKLLDQAYAGRASATGKSDWILLLLTVFLSSALLLSGADPISFLGGLLAGGTFIQLYFHAFNVPVDPEDAAPEPSSPIKVMSYAIQAAPWRPWKVLLVYATFVIVCIVLYWAR